MRCYQRIDGICLRRPHGLDGLDNVIALSRTARRPGRAVRRMGLGRRDGAEVSRRRSRVAAHRRPSEARRPVIPPTGCWRDYGLPRLRPNTNIAQLLRRRRSRLRPTVGPPPASGPLLLVEELLSVVVILRANCIIFLLLCDSRSSLPTTPLGCTTVLLLLLPHLSSSFAVPAAVPAAARTSFLPGSYASPRKCFAEGAVAAYGVC